MERKQENNSLISRYEVMSQKEAVVFFEEAAFYQIIRYYINRNENRKALCALSTALTQHAASVVLQLASIELYLLTGENEKALTTLQLVSKNIPEHKLHEFYRIEAYCSFVRFDKAISLLSRLQEALYDEKERRPVGINTNFYTNLNEFSTMFEHLCNAILENPEDKHTLQQMWMSVELSGRYEDSEDFHQIVLQTYPLQANAWYNLAYAEMNLGKIEEALDSFEFAFIIDPLFEQAYLEFGALASKHKQYNRALQAYHDMGEVLEMKSEVIIRTGECYAALGHEQIAHKVYAKALELDKNCPMANFQMGNVLISTGNDKKALEHFKFALKLDPNNDFFHLSIAKLQLKLGNKLSALKHLRIASDIAPDNVNCWVAFVQYYLDANNIPKALRIIEEGLEYIPDPELFVCKGICLLRKGAREEAIYWISEAIQEGFSNPEMLFNLSPESRYDREIKQLFEQEV